jgi:tRNA-specific 2-thiouridylase
MTQAQLAKTRMPLGNFTKPQVRAMAEAAGLKTAQKQESQDICFAPAGYAEFIAARRPDLARPGAIVDEDGRLLGEHNGTFRYTIGQRRGLGVASDRPLYVKSVYAAANSVTLADESSLYSSTAVLRDINLIEAASLPSPLKLTAKHRYNGTAREAVAVQTGSDELEVTFTQPQKAVTPGQALVLYNGEFVFGGGTVVSVR